MTRDDDTDIDIDDSSENVLSEWPRSVDEPSGAARPTEAETGGAATADPTDTWSIAAPAIESEPSCPSPRSSCPSPSPSLNRSSSSTPSRSSPSPTPTAEPPSPSRPRSSTRPGIWRFRRDTPSSKATADGGRRAVGLVVSRFNGNVTSRLLDRALEELEVAGVRREAITIMVVPGAFELPVAATALAKTRRFACIVALGCVIRGDTPHFDYVASEAASGLQLAALETGVPVSFGLLTLDRIEQAEPRVEKGAEAVRSALEMADVFSHLSAAASR